MIEIIVAMEKERAVLRMPDKLKPCPFCGGEAKIITHDFFVPEAKQFLTGSYGVECTSCHAEGYQFWNTEEQAVAAWNRRGGQNG